MLCDGHDPEAKRRCELSGLLWNGNREPLPNFFRLDPEENIIRWTWVKHPEYVERYGAAGRDPGNAHLRFVRLDSQNEIDAFCAEPANYPGGQAR
jgi:hypothetical protein